jgi:hypothetical protein
MADSKRYNFPHCPFHEALKEHSHPVASGYRKTLSSEKFPFGVSEVNRRNSGHLTLSPVA